MAIKLMHISVLIPIENIEKFHGIGGSKGKYPL